MMLLSNCDLEALAAALGGPQNLCVQDESEFLEETGCRPEELEDFLANRWILCDVEAVLAEKQRVAWGAVFVDAARRE
jgi:hypothetical protein